MKPAIRFEHVSKRYRLGERRGSTRDLAARLSRRWRGLPAEAETGYLWALRDLSFELQPGEALGIIGPNGSGKTTTLKLLSYITRPTEGRIEMQGRVASLIELGAGFHPELTGRENVYLNGTILGLRRAEIEARFDEIVAFAELEQFIDTPVKRYSSGMYARLGFSVAVHVSPDVLLVDEVLAVGDMNFQNRCFERMRQLRSADRALVFISHNLFAVRDLCTRAIFLARGRVQAAGSTDDVIRAYQSYAAQEQAQAGRASVSPTTLDHLTGEPPIRITGAQFLTEQGQPAEVFEFGGRMIVRINYRARQPVQEPTFSFVFFRADGTVCEGSSTILRDQPLGCVAGEGYVEFEIENLALIPSVYTLETAISNQHVITYDLQHTVNSFRVETHRPIHFPRFVAMIPGEWRIARKPATGE